MQEGPFAIGGVGGATVPANSEWVALLDRGDGKKQGLQGLNVNKITADLLEAVTDVKKDAPNNSTLQKCSSCFNTIVIIYMTAMLIIYMLIVIPDSICIFVQKSH